MREILTGLFKSTPFYRPIRNWILPRRHQKELEQWEKNDRHGPSPHIVKQQTLKHYADKYQLKVLVETGTFMGDMVAAMIQEFDQLYSIELNEELYIQAKKRFSDNEKVMLIQGDSGIELGRLMNKLERPTLFWLDGHYSAGVTAKGAKDTPIYEELAHIFSVPDKGHVIVIDDARLFGTDPSYPGLEELDTFIRSRRPNVNIAIENDSIRVTPGPA